MEAIGGLEARKAGYDVFRVEDKKQPEFSEIVILNKDIAREINQPRPPEMQLDGVIETGRGTISDEGINAIQAVRDRWVNEGKGPTPEEIHQYPFLEDVFKGQKPGKSDYVPPQELAGAARAIDQARISQRTSPGTARLAQHLLTLDPTFDQNSTLEISDAVHKATPDIIKREGLDPEGEYAILGKTVSHIEDAATRTAISLYKGHDADTLVEEWYHRAYDRLNPKDRAAYDAYHKKTGDTRSPNEHFAQEGRDFFFSDKLHEAAGGIRRIFEGAREALKALIKRVRDLRGAKIPKKIQEMYRRAGRKSGEPLRNSNEYEPDPGDSGLTETSYQIRLFNEGKDVDCKPITNALMKGKKIGAQQINAWLKAARAAGVSKKGIDRAVRTFIKYNKMKDEGPIAWLPVPVDSVVLREGVLNTPAVEGVRRERLDNLYQDINIGSRSSATGALFEGGEERTGIPKEVRGLVPQPFLNIPITQPRLQTAPPSGHKYPLVVTGNPHVDNFRRPHKGWDNHIKVVRVKPVLGGNAKVTKAVTDAIRYAQDIGARVLITTFRAKQPWILAKYTSFLPTDPNDPNFSTFWKENPNPKPSDPKKLPDWTPYVPRNQKVADAFRANGWDIEKNIYGTGGTWWWPKSKDLDPEVQKAIGKTELEYCDLMHQGCPSCRNCQKLTYPDAAGAPIIGVTDEPFCEHGCPQCFVRLGQSGVGGRGGISLGQNAKQAGFGKPDLGDIYKQTVSILQGVVRPAGSTKVDYVSKFLHGTPAEKMDAAMSLYIDGEINPHEFNTIREEIGNEVGSIADQILPEERVSYQLRKSESPWYSQLERVVESPKFPNRAPGAQMAQALESWAKNGEIKQEELDWSGVIDWLKAQGPKVSKEQVLDYLRQNNVQIQEVMKGEDIQELPKEWEVIRDKIVETGEPFWSVVTETGETYEMGKTREQAIENALKSLNRHSEGRTGTKYSSYQLPGGENYKELLLTLPDVRESVQVGEAEPIGREYGNEEFMGMWEGRYPIMGVKTYPFSIGNQSGRITYWPWTVKPNGDKGPERYIVDSPNMQNARFVSMETAMAAIEESYNESGYMKQARSDQYRSSHWDEPNILAHIRFNERTDTNGKRVLFIEEIQSDWHQEGRKKGYRIDEKERRDLVKKNEGLFDLLTKKSSSEYATPEFFESAGLSKDASFDDIAAKFDENQKRIDKGSIPNAPFKKTWPMLAFKRMVRYAAENGYDRIAWTTGEMQAERYDLSKQISKVTYLDKNTGGIADADLEGEPTSGTLRAYDLNGSQVIQQYIDDPSKIADYIGKEAASKLLEQKPSKAREAGFGFRKRAISGLDLKVGGEGMKGFYDKILPSEVNKFFGKGKWGNAKVGDTKIITKPEVKSRPVEGQPGLVYEGLPAEIVPVHSLDITPEMKQKALAEGMPYYQARKINKDQADLDAGARDARRVADQQLGKKPQDIDKGFFEGITDLKPIRDLLHELGIKDKYDGITLTNKDYVDVYKYLQMPADVKISHPEFGPLYDRQRERELSKAILDHAFAKKTEPYFKGMDDADRIKVDAALIQGEQEGVSFYDPLQLKERFGLNERQIAGYTAIRDSLDAAGEMLLWEMEQSGVKPEALEEFKTRLAGYVPHKWYGNWAIIVRKKGGKKTKFMTKTNFLDRYTERDRVQALYPNDEVFVMQSKKIPYEAYQDAAPWAVSKMVDLVIDKAEVSPAMADELKQALGDLYKSKGFGAHFIKRKGTPGWTEDLAKPLAEYFAGLNGYMTKMRAIKGFAEDIQAIDPKKKPNLYRYALDYIRYVTGEPFEFAGAKQAAYIYYLYANIKSAAVNLTQNMLLGWPVLAKHTRLAGAKLLQAQARAANRHMLTDGEKAFLEEMESLGYLDPKMAVEMGAFTANPLLRQIPQGVKDFGEFIDIFQHMEAWNRRAMAVALYDSGIREPMRAAELIEEAHFRYSKGNRPELMRGIISPIMTFRSWMINYVTWLKNEIKAGRLAPVARSLAAMVLLGGFAGLPFFKLLKKLWVKVFGEDPQTAAAKHIGKSWATLIFRGLPSKLGISFTGSIGLGDILPTDLKSLGGVFADIPGRIARVIKDLSSRDYVRALEDASPEAIRQPMAAYRSATEGDTTRSGAPIFDPTTGEQQRLTAGEAATKSLGFQPMRSAERWDLQETVQQIQDARTARKQEWANRYVVAMRAGNKKEVARVVREINDYNKRMKAAGRPDDMITKAEVLSAIQSRKKAGVPPKYMRPKWKRLLEGRGMMPSQ